MKTAGFVVAVLLVASRAEAIEFELSAQQRFIHQSLADEVLFSQLRFSRSSTFTSDFTAFEASVYGAVRGRPFDALGLELGIDTGLISVDGRRVLGNGKPFGEHARETLLLGETFGELQLGETGVLAIRAGKLIQTIGGGAIFDAYAFAVSADADFSLIDSASPWRLRFDVMSPDATFTKNGKNSPLFQLEIGNRVIEGGELWMFGAGFVDGGDGLAPLFADAIFRGRLAQLRAAFPRLGANEAVLEGIRNQYGAGVFGFDTRTSGWLGWGGLGFRYDDERWRFDVVAIYGFGNIDTTVVSYPEMERALRMVPLIGRSLPMTAFLRSSEDGLSVKSGLLDLNAGFRFTRSLELGGFIVAATGDADAGRSDRDPAYRGFVSISPRLPYTTLFFNGGLATTLASPTVASIAPDGSGLVALGLNAHLIFGDRLEMRPILALLSASTGRNVTGGRFYGYEADLLLDLHINRVLLFRMDGALFVPGSYYGDVPVGGQITFGAVIDLET